MRLDRKLWLTAEKDRVVEDGDPDAAFLLGAEGADVPDAEAERLGLNKPKAKDAPANKARKAAPNK